MPGGVNGQFGGWGQNPNWGGTMPDPNRRISPGSGGGSKYPSNLTRPPNPNYANSERQYWEFEIRRLEEEMNRLRRLPASDRVSQMLEQIRQELKQARLEYARAKTSAPDQGSGFGDSSGLNISQSQGQGEGSGGMSPDDFMRWMDRFMGRASGWKSKFSNEAEIPGAWSPEDAGPAKASMDPMAVIRSAQPRLQEEMNRSMAGAAQRLGNTGALMGSGYTKELGKAARKSTSDLAEIMNKYLYESSENAANREQESRQSALDRSLSAWGTRGGWQMDQGLQGEAQWAQQLPQLLQMFAGMMPGVSWR